VNIDGPLTLRTGTVADITAVLELWIEAGAHPTSTDDVASVTALVARQSDALVIAELDGQMVGTLIATWDGWRGNLYRLAVRPDLRRRGVAAALVREGERRLGRHGCRRVSALVANGDVRAAAFWTALDYPRDALERHVRTLPPGPGPGKGPSAPR
jgi:ribosomal protein S18 acetylase RimI-like enzyme